MNKILVSFAIAVGIVSCEGMSSNDPKPLEADFNSATTVLIEGAQTSFQVQSDGNPSEYRWTFEGGTPATSELQSPTVTYIEEGSFLVSLTVIRDNDSTTVSKANFITVVPLFSGDNIPTSEPCKLDKIYDFDYVDLGFPNNGPSPSLGTINVQILFADFPDVRATQSTASVFSILDPINTKFFEEMSYGRLNVNLIPHNTWLRLDNPSTYYGESLRSAQEHLAFIQEAVDKADSEVDFSETDIVVVVANPDAEAIPYGPTFGSLDENFSIKADGNSILTGINSGYDLNFWGGLWLAHEMGHSLGLPDLYSYTSANTHQYVGGFDMMGLISGEAPGFVAYERWLLGWLDDSQIYCHAEGSVAIEIQELASSGGLKAVMVPLTNTKALVVESRKRKGFDSALSKEGVLVYTVDTSTPRGEGPIRLKPNSQSGEMKQNAPMLAGEQYTYEGITVNVIRNKSSSDIVIVTRE